MKVAILGGTKGMGRSLSRLFAERGDAVCLLGRDAEELTKSAADLRVRGTPKGANVFTATCDLADPSTFEPALDLADQQLGGLDTVVLTAAVFATQDALEKDPALAHQLLLHNFTHTVTFCEHARRRLLKKGGGTLCVFSSVAGERGRKPVILYGAAKAGLTQYLEGLDHKFRAQGLKTVCVKPGFVKTGMTAGLTPPPFAGEPDAVAKDVLAAIDRGSPVVYTPAIWGLVMLAIRSLPRFAMRKLNF